MYVATQDFNSYLFGSVKKGDKVQFNKTFFDAGMIEEVEEVQDIEVKPEIKPAVQTKPHNYKKKGRK